VAGHMPMRFSKVACGRARPTARLSLQRQAIHTPDEGAERGAKGKGRASGGARAAETE
jgi:hypothetical protein